MNRFSLITLSAVLLVPFETTILKSNSLNRGKISFKTNEYKVKINKDRNFQFEKILPLDSYKIIEEFMIVANIVVADFFVRLHEQLDGDYFVLNSQIILIGILNYLFQIFLLPMVSQL